jgi:YidC/Oxa1 family membrane protein insertase
VLVLASSPLDPLYNAIGYVLAFFYLPLANLGIAIILLTLVVMAVQFPLIAKQTRSMIQMQRVQPEMKKIQQKYKDDRQKQNEELMKLYQEHHINPLAGCLPLIVTFPIGIAVFRTFSQGVQRHIPQSGPFNKLYNDICTKAVIAYGKTTAAAKKPPVKLKSDLNACTYGLDHFPKGKTPPVFRFLGMNLNWSAHEVQTQLSGHYLQWVPYFFLIALVILTGWYQVRQTQARQMRQGGNAQVNPQMQAITKVMPVFFGLITYGLNAATTMYFLVSNAWRIGQQHFVLNKMYEEDAQRPKGGTGTSPPADAEPPPPPKSGGNGGGKPTGSKPAKPKADGPANRNGGADDGGANRSMSGAARRKRKRKR